MFNGKAIYNPSGKAGEYARWACNLYVGCSNDCDYCYCKKGVLSSVMGAPKATLKKVFKDLDHAFTVFMSELSRNADAIRSEGGLFFSFSTDPCLPETIDLTMMCVMFATGMDVPCRILTKCTGWASSPSVMDSLRMVKDKVAIGFTLTGMDDMERGRTVASNKKRIELMKKLHREGFKTFASIEPVVDVYRAGEVFELSLGGCDFYEIGLMSGKKNYDWDELHSFVSHVNLVLSSLSIPLYWKESVKKVLGYIPLAESVVGPNFNMFNQLARTVRLNGKNIPCEDVLKIQKVKVSDQVFVEFTYRDTEPSYHEVAVLVPFEKAGEIEAAVREYQQLKMK